MDTNIAMKLQHWVLVSGFTICYIRDVERPGAPLTLAFDVLTRKSNSLPLPKIALKRL
jgi:hypothetical protein